MHFKTVVRLGWLTHIGSKDNELIDVMLGMIESVLKQRSLNVKRFCAILYMSLDEAKGVYRNRNV